MVPWMFLRFPARQLKHDCMYLCVGRKVYRLCEGTLDVLVMRWTSQRTWTCEGEFAFGPSMFSCPGPQSHGPSAVTLQEDV